MKKLLAVLLLIVMSASAYSQNGHNQISVGADLGITVGKFSDGFQPGFGGYIKGLFGIGETDQLSFTTGYMGFKAKGLISPDRVTASIIPLMFGFRSNVKKFYIEPQAGANIFGAKFNLIGMSGSDSKVGFGYAIGVGCVVSDIDLGIRYQGGKPGGSDGEESVNWGFVGIHIGYNFNLKSKK